MKLDEYENEMTPQSSPFIYWLNEKKTLILPRFNGKI